MVVRQRAFDGQQGRPRPSTFEVTQMFEGLLQPTHLILILAIALIAKESYFAVQGAKAVLRAA